MTFPDGGTPRVSGDTFTARVWDRHFGVSAATMDHGMRVTAAAMEPARQSAAATASEDMTVKVWRSREAMARMRKINEKLCDK